MSVGGHGGRGVDAEDDSDVFSCVSSLFCLFYLRCCFHQVIDRTSGSLFTLIYVNWLLVKAELARPHLPLLVLLRDLAIYVENGLAILALLGVACSHFSCSLEARERQSEYVRVRFLFVQRAFLHLFALFFVECFQFVAGTCWMNFLFSLLLLSFRFLRLLSVYVFKRNNVIEVGNI